MTSDTHVGPKTPRLSLIEASKTLRLHPYLLLKCVRYTARRNGGIKLSCKTENGESTFTTDELLAFDADLRKPWASGSEKRPDIPEYFQAILRHETGFACALCSSPYGTEFAHIDDWSTSLNHHPHNLVALCSTCHTGYDVEKRISQTEVRAAKERILKRFDDSLSSRTEADMQMQELRAICRRINVLLNENHLLFLGYGPRSALATDFSNEEIGTVWRHVRTTRMLPNNSAIRSLLQTHHTLIQADTILAEAAQKFITHSLSYEAFVAVPNTTHSRFPFPEDFAQRIKELADGG